MLASEGTPMVVNSLESVAFPTLAESDLQKLSRCAAAKRE